MRADAVSGDWLSTPQRLVAWAQAARSASAPGRLAWNAMRSSVPWALARRPARATAMASFFASLIQLSLLLMAASLDALLR